VQATPPSQESGQQDTAQPATEEQTPLPDVGQFTLVLQNGARVEAVAFTRMQDRIVYITADGSRRTLAVADLDSAAKVRVNEERGTPLQLPL
jgi:hypothetical protein